jgi:CTP:molybdopterin cytidylyltransferase MocA
MRSINFAGCKVVINEDFNGGLASSLILGYNGLGSIRTMIVMLGDQPNLRLETIHFLLSEHKRLGALITVPLFRGTLGSLVVVNRAIE